MINARAIVVEGAKLQGLSQLLPGMLTLRLNGNAKVQVREGMVMQEDLQGYISLIWVNYT